MNPFESGFVSVDGLNAVMDKKIASKMSRTVQGISRMFFYNPMWGRMGDTSIGPPGTYYYNDSSHVSYFWNLFDQVIFRPQLLPYFSEKSLEVIDAISEESLLAEDGIPDKTSGSDHLPIIFRINIEKEV